MPKFLEVTNKAAALAAVGIKTTYYVDNYGSDPTGQSSSDAAVQAALTAMGANPGVLRFGSGVYLLSQTVTVGPYQSVIGDSPGLTVLKYSGNSDAIRARDTRAFTAGTISTQSSRWIAGGVAGPGLGGKFEGLTIDGSEGGEDACGVHIGDMTNVDIDVVVKDFDGSGGKGIWFDNKTTWTEYARARAAIHNCKEAVVFETNGGTNSFGYGNFDFHVLSWPNQTGVRMTNAVPYFCNIFNLTGGFYNGTSSGSNTGKVLHLTGNTIFDASGCIQVEANGQSGYPGHKTIVREDTASMRFNGRLDFLASDTVSFSNGSGPWSTLVLSGLINVDDLIGRHGSQQHFSRIIGGSTGTPSQIDPNDGILYYLGANWFSLNLPSGNTTLTPANYVGYPQPNFQAASFDIFIRQPASGAAGTMTWPSAWVWVDGQPPKLSTTNSAVDWIKVTTTDFVNWYATHMNPTELRLDTIRNQSGFTTLRFAGSGTNDWLIVSSGSSGSGPLISSNGDGANVDMNFSVKGTGRYWFYPGADQTVVQFRTDGTAENIGFAFGTKGAGRITQSGVNMPTVSSVDTFTNKTISGASNTLTNIPQASVTNLTNDLAAIRRTILNITSAETLGATGDYVLLIGASGAPTLPTAVGNTSLYVLKNIHSSDRTVSTTSSQTIEGLTTYTLPPNAAITVVSDNANWRIIS